MEGFSNCNFYFSLLSRRIRKEDVLDCTEDNLFVFLRSLKKKKMQKLEKLSKQKFAVACKLYSKAYAEFLAFFGMSLTSSIHLSIFLELMFIYLF